MKQNYNNNKTVEFEAARPLQGSFENYTRHLSRNNTAICDCLYARLKEFSLCCSKHKMWKTDLSVGFKKTNKIFQL